MIKLLYVKASFFNDFKSFSSGSTKKIAKRQVNRQIERNIAPKLRLR